MKTVLCAICGKRIHPFMDKWSHGSSDASHRAIPQDDPDIPPRNAESETAGLRALVGELADDAMKTDTVLFYIGNLAHQAWNDPKNVEALFRRIEAYAKDRRKENAELLARAEEATKP